jgi:hypothetical protein
MSTATLSEGRHASWVDRLTGGLERLPLPEALTYGVVATVLVGAWVGAQWMTEPATAGRVPLLAVVLPALTTGAVWLVAIFNRGAVRALRIARSLVAGGPDRADELERTITAMPPVPTLAVTALAAVVSLARMVAEQDRLQKAGLSLTPPAAWFALVLLPLFAAVVSVYALKVGHLGWQVHRVMTRELRIDLWDVPPLFAFATLTARMAGSVVVATCAVYLAAPDLFSDVVSLTAVGSGLVLATAVFVLPLAGVHGRLVVAKQAALGDAARQMEQAIGELATAVRTQQLERMDPLNKGIGAIEAAQRAIERVPTWPWTPETFRWVVGAVMFPILLFVFQAVLGRLLGR